MGHLSRIIVKPFCFCHLVEDKTFEDLDLLLHFHSTLALYLYLTSVVVLFKLRCLKHLKYAIFMKLKSELKRRLKNETVYLTSECVQMSEMFFFCVAIQHEMIVRFYRKKMLQLY